MRGEAIDFLLKCVQEIGLFDLGCKKKSSYLEPKHIVVSPTRAAHPWGGTGQTTVVLFAWRAWRGSASLPLIR